MFCWSNANLTDYQYLSPFSTLKGILIYILFVRQKGSHIILVKKSETGKKLKVPNHKEVDKGTLLEIIRQAGLTRVKFMELIK